LNRLLVTNGRNRTPTMNVKAYVLRFAMRPTAVGLAVLGIVGTLVVLSVSGDARQLEYEARYSKDAEFHLARLGYPTYSYANSRGYSNNPMWRVDFPDAEFNFLPALARTTNLSVDLSAYIDLRESAERLHLQALDEDIFKYPFLITQQPGAAGWRPSEEEAAALREYMERGGFLLIDDFHGNDYSTAAAALKRIFPNREVIEIPDDDPLMHIFYDLDDRLQIPGDRQLSRFGGGGQPRMEGPPYWLGIYDDRNRLMVALNYNMDMGDAWEHADDPNYPAPMTGQAYRLGINYVIYAMTH
jgi:hypothetical protein